MAIRVPKPGEGGKAFTPCPKGTFSAVCVDVVDLGELDSGFKNDDGTPKIVHKVRIVWQVSKKMENGKPFIVDNRYNLSLNEYNGKKSNLRALLDAWGVNLMDLVDESNEYDLEALIGCTCLLNVVHVQGTKDATKTFANIASIMPLPEEFKALEPREYVRVINRPKKEEHSLADFPEDAGDPGPDDSDIPF